MNLKGLKKDPSVKSRQTRASVVVIEVRAVGSAVGGL